MYSGAQPWFMVDGCPELPTRCYLPRKSDVKKYRLTIRRADGTIKTYTYKLVEDGIIKQPVGPYVFTLDPPDIPKTSGVYYINTPAYAKFLDQGYYPPIKKGSYSLMMYEDSAVRKGTPYRVWQNSARMIRDKQFGFSYF